jgi:hypothetical protein
MVPVIETVMVPVRPVLIGVDVSPVADIMCILRFVGNA